MQKKYNQSGRSMIEMLGVLAIVGVLSAGGIAGYSMAMQTRKLYKGDYTDLDIQDLIDAGKITDITNPFGGNLSIDTSGWGNDMFAIVVPGNIPADVCTDIVQVDWGDRGVFEGIYFMRSTGSITLRYGNGYWPSPTQQSIASCTGGVTSFSLSFR